MGSIEILDIRVFVIAGFAFWAFGLGVIAYMKLRARIEVIQKTLDDIVRFLDGGVSR